MTYDLRSEEDKHAAFYIGGNFETIVDERLGVGVGAFRFFHAFHNLFEISMLFGFLYS
jgi:hypothetical protein